MRTKYIFLAGCMLLAMNGTLAQPWDQGGNNVTLPTDYLGCDGSSTFPLHLRTIPDLSIDFSTSNLLRMRLYPNQSSTIGGVQNVNQHGFLGLIGHENFFAGVGPFTRLHLADNSGNPILNAQDFGFRRWQRNGITFTGNSDQSFIGHKYESNDNTDFVIQWVR